MSFAGPILPADPPAAIGPTTPARGDIYRVAREVEALARLARELSFAGPHCDPARAQRQLDKARALLGADFNGPRIEGE